MTVAANKIVFPNGDTLQDVKNMGIYVCTSATRPSSPFEGQHIYETDTDDTLKWNGASWNVVGGGTGFVTNPLQADLNTNGYALKNSAGTLTMKSSNGLFLFQKI